MVTGDLELETSQHETIRNHPKPSELILGKKV